MTWGGENRSTRSRQAEWKGGWEGEGNFSATDCHTVYRLFMNKLCVSLGHCCGPVTMASVVRGRGMWPYWATGMEREGARGEIWRGVFASDYFSHWSHLHLTARAQPPSLSLLPPVSHHPPHPRLSELRSSSHVLSLSLFFHSPSITVPSSSPASPFHLGPRT